MSFNSILYKRTEDYKSIADATTKVPAFLIDLNLDQIIDDITSGKEEYNLKPFFFTSLGNTDSIKYRQEIMFDLENQTLFRHIKSFAESMQTIRKQLSTVNKLNYKYHKERLFLDVVKMYCETVYSLENYLSLDNIKSHGLLSFREYLTNYVKFSDFNLLITKARLIIASLSSIKYCVHIKGLAVKVFRYEAEPNYNTEIEETFARFKQDKVKNYRVGFAHTLDMNHVEAQILDGVAQLFPDIFLKLDTFCTANKNFIDETIATFDREIQFYISYIEYIAILKKAGLKFCYPQISDTSKEIYCNETFDLVLAHKLVNKKSSVIINDFYLKDEERIFVVSGPNQSGKTTFARTFGQLHFLASIGCPVPGREAKLFLYDKLFTHCEKKENIKDLRGKLEDDLFRIHEILNLSTTNSIIIMNEIFTSTTLKDAIFLGKKIMKKLIDLDLLCVWVTFVDELATYSEQIVSMTGTVIPENPDLRTYKIIRKPADGLAYAYSIAEKYQLNYDSLIKRIKV